MADCKLLENHQVMMAQLYELKAALQHIMRRADPTMGVAVLESLKGALKHYKKAKLFWNELECHYMILFFRAELTRESFLYMGTPIVLTLNDHVRLVFEEFIRMEQVTREQQIHLLIKLADVYREAGLFRKQAFYQYLAASKAEHGESLPLLKVTAQELYGLPLLEVSRPFSVQELKMIQRDLTYESQGARKTHVLFHSKDETLDGE